MAIIRLTTGKTISVDAHKGAHVWHVLNGEKQPTNEQQRAFISQVESVMLNWRTAPMSYIAANLDTLEQMPDFRSGQTIKNSGLGG